MARRGAKSGKLAQSIFAIGDVDSGGASAADRMAIIDDTERVVLKNAEGGVKLRTGEIIEQIERHETRLRLRAQLRDDRARSAQPKLDMASRWREVGAQERYPHAELPAWALGIIFFVLAALDFFVFAQAYAFVDDVADFSVQWWLGGLLGLTVFIAGFVLARQLKGLIVGRAQTQTLNLAHTRIEDQPTDANERTSRADLVPIDVPLWSLLPTSLIFVALCGAGIWVRYDATGAGLGALLLPALVPFAIIVVELYLYDPLQRRGPKPNFIDRRLEQRINRLKFRHDNVLQTFETFVDRTKASYDMERSNAAIIAADLGMSVEANQRVQGESSAQPRGAGDVE